MEKTKNIDRGTVIRTVILALALTNQLLTAFGIRPLPIEDANIDMLISTAWTLFAAVWSWWKNNNITQEAIKAQAYLDELKSIDYSAE
jgi:SPP1 family holin